MAFMYSRQTKIFFTLVVLSVLIGSYFLFIWWSERQVITSVATNSTLLQFSDVYRVADSTRDYASGALIITDIESNAEFKKLFFTDQVSIPTKETISQELLKVADYLTFKTASSAEHVFNTSYYIGNYEVLPEKTLQSWLFSADRKATTKLLETALADVRAGVVTVQDLYDVAPPYLYGPQATSSRVYFETPSFPSLTMSEVAITALLMAKIDSTQARLYEAQARQYAHEVYASGAHFEADIAGAIALAEVYIAEMERNDRYQDLFSSAMLEWGDESYVVGDTFSLPTRSLFTFTYFPYQSSVSFSGVTNYDYRVSYSEEMIGGQLRLSLIDTRLPHPSMRLYEYEFETASTTQIVPIALELQQGSSGKMREVMAFANYDVQQPDSFLFLTGKTGSNGNLFAAGTASLQSVSEGVVTPILTIGSLLDKTYSRNQISYTKADLFIESKHGESLADIVHVPLRADGAVPNIVATGTSPTVAFGDILLYVGSDTEVMARRIQDREPVLVEGLTVANERYATRSIRYFDQTKILLVTDNWVDKNLIPHATVSIYTITQSRDGITADLKYQFTSNDTIVASTMVSPGGRYVALGTTEATGERAPKVLIFDTFDGIIKKEVDLQPFLASAISIDGWTLD